MGKTLLEKKIVSNIVFLSFGSFKMWNNFNSGGWCGMLDLSIRKL